MSMSQVHDVRFGWGIDKEDHWWKELSPEMTKQSQPE